MIYDWGYKIMEDHGHLPGTFCAYYLWSEPAQMMWPLAIWNISL